MASTQVCNDPDPHGGHTWYAPGPPGSAQVEHWCPGVR